MAKTKRKSLTDSVSPKTTTSSQTRKGRLSGRASADNSSVNVSNMPKGKGKGKIVKTKRKKYVMRIGEHYVPTYMTKQLFKQIAQLQRSTKFLIPRSRFIKLVREIIMEYYPHSNYNLGYHAAEALQEAAESYLVIFLQESNLCARHARRVTLKTTDMQLLQMLRNDSYLTR